MNETPHVELPAIVVGQVRLEQEEDHVLLSHLKRPDLKIPVPASVLERWAMRQMRELVFL